MKKYILILFGVLFLCTNIYSQEKKITIKVRDSNNKPVAGAIILFDNVKQRIWTNSKGIFKTRLKFEPTEISAFHPNIGIKKIKYNGKDRLTIVIKKGNDIDLNNSPINSKIVDARQYSNIYDYLNGKVSGVSITSGNNIFIRGYNSVNGSLSPLLIVNGVEVSKDSFGAINPSEIKSIKVLKGPGSSIYGVRGANGVIVVETN